MTATLFPAADLAEVFSPTPSRRRPWRVETRDLRGDRIARIGSYATEAAAIDRAGGLALTMARSNESVATVVMYHRDSPAEVLRIDPLSIRSTLRLLDGVKVKQVGL